MTNQYSRPSSQPCRILSSGIYCQVCAADHGFFPPKMDQITTTSKSAISHICSASGLAKPDNGVYGSQELLNIANSAVEQTYLCVEANGRINWRQRFDFGLGDHQQFGVAVSSCSGVQYNGSGSSWHSHCTRTGSHDKVFCSNCGSFLPAATGVINVSGHSSCRSS